jgi:hypothetical protein
MAWGLITISGLIPKVVQISICIGVRIKGIDVHIGEGAKVMDRESGKGKQSKCSRRDLYLKEILYI